MMFFSISEQRVCGRCLRPVAYLDVGDRIVVLDGLGVDTGRVLLVARHVCPNDPAKPAEGTPEAQRSRLPDAPWTRPDTRLPTWCLDRMLLRLEEAWPDGLTTEEVLSRTFAPSVTAPEVLDSLIALARYGDVLPLTSGSDPVRWFRTPPGR